ncbi:hypothetical protein C4588_02810 [Candidatus Parcubacteria bacterium]|nr:MAG: hypothetical protein C4588_02810 [Candidatus Parcubacteria bacterium]
MLLDAATALQRAGTAAKDCADFIEKVLEKYNAFFHRLPDAGMPGSERRLSFSIAWLLNKSDRRALIFDVLDGGLLHLTTTDSRMHVTVGKNETPNLYWLMRKIINGRLAYPFSQLVDRIIQAINTSQIVNLRTVERKPEYPRPGPQPDTVYIFVEAKIDPESFRPPLHLKFELTRSVYSDRLIVSIEDTLGWGTVHEVQGQIITGTHWTFYGGEAPEEEWYGQPEYTYYEIIPNLDAVPDIIKTIFNRFRGEI